MGRSSGFVAAGLTGLLAARVMIGTVFVHWPRLRLRLIGHSRLSNVIGDQDPSLLSSMMRSRGTRTFYQVRIGADTRPAADTLCNRIRRAGAGCFVLRNPGVRG